MIADLVVIGLGLKVIVGAVKRGRQQQPTGAPPPPGQAAPRPQVGGTRRYAASMVAPAKGGPDPSSVPDILSPFQITVKGAPAARRLLAQPQTLDSDLPGQDHRHLSVGRGSPSPAVPTSAEGVNKVPDFVTMTAPEPDKPIADLADATPYSRGVQQPPRVDATLN